MDDGDDRFIRKTPAGKGPVEYSDVSKKEKGDVNIPYNEYFRIRTRTGHQLLMHNSEDLIYIGNSKGTTWIELTSNGKIDIYAQDSISIHSENDLNFRADRDINFEAGRNVNIKAAGGKMQLESVGSVNIIAAADGKITVGAGFDLVSGSGTKLSSGGATNIKSSGTNIDGGDINLNSGTANPFNANSTLLDNGILSDIYGDTTSAFEQTGLVPLPTKIANPQNAIGKGLSSIFGGFGGGGSGGKGILGFLGKLPSAVGENSLGGGAILLGGSGFVASGTGSGFGNIFGSGGSLGDLLPGNLLDQGKNLIKSFTDGNITNIDLNIPKQILGSKAVLNEFANWTDIPAVAQLSKHFNVGDLSSRVKEVGLQNFLSAQGNLGLDEIATNLKSLAVNALDPLKDRFPNMEISDAFKPVAAQLLDSDPDSPLSKMFTGITKELGGKALDAVKEQLETVTPFNLGQAANLQFKGADASEYFSIAQWVKDNVPYDQIKLEYSTIGSGTPWITVVHKQEGNRDVDAEDKVITTVNGEVVANYLVDMTQA
jgi:hypothetical protein